jgi:hypothetical protein
MTDIQINVAIAKILGWKLDGWGVWRKNGEFYVETRDLPWVQSLDAIHELESDFDSAQSKRFGDMLCHVFENQTNPLTDPVPWKFGVWHASARQRAEAFLRMMGKWEEAE